MFKYKNIFSVITTESFLLIAYPDKPRVDYVYFSKKPAPTQGVVKVEKLNSYEPKVSNFNRKKFLLVEKYEFRQIGFTSKLAFLYRLCLWTCPDPLVGSYTENLPSTSIMIW